MFHEASTFNQPIASWNTEKVNNMQLMFHHASTFNHDIYTWTGTAATTAQTSMFDGATAFQAKYTCTNAVTGPASSCTCTSCIPEEESFDPPKCVPPGGDKLQYNGPNWICVCASGWTGDTCEIEPIFYLCGWSGMINDTRENLTELGYEMSKDIRVEIFFANCVKVLGLGILKFRSLMYFPMIL